MRCAKCKEDISSASYWQLGTITVCETCHESLDAETCYGPVMRPPEPRGPEGR